MKNARLKVGIDVSATNPQFKEHAGRGIGRYVSELSAVLPDDHKTVSIDTFDFRDFSMPAVVEKAISCLPAGRQTVRQQLCYPLQLGRGSMKKFDVLHFPAHMDAPSWSPVPYIVTVLDLIPLICRDIYEAEVSSWRFRLARWLELRAIKNAAMILAISQCTAQDVNRILDVPMERIRVTYLGIDPVFFQPSQQEDELELLSMFPQVRDRQFMSYVGGIDPRKNVPQLIRTFGAVVERFRERGAQPPCLVLIGRIEQDRNYGALVSLVAALGLEDLVIFTGYLPDAKMRTLVRLSDLFVFPSLYEGFGLPPLEAMAMGVPVLAAKNSCLPEILGCAAHWFEPNSVDEGSATVDALLTNTDFRISKRHLGISQARRFTWDATATATLAAYEWYARELSRGNLLGMAA
jgi:glycosyltransferase involved in cell wall biosynthesis